ncbi:hypothetical protein KIK06_23255 [Nocardiopsis sp. EMB25]|uniref:ABC transporter substrate-binding protein n=1 Tax=Nocardiopsis sp. EMB25 TaxID=2835867 RepID=UPI0022845C57|nr:hypothetical protein [Nocardiopsis sp. EMB25]MCY9786804.1 hypothetical protein [Nocardiopsis sp. EMB25]
MADQEREPAGGGVVIPRPQRFRRTRRLLLPVAVAVVLAMVATSVVLWDRFSCGGPGSGVRSVEGQCVGVTDGGHVFHDDFAGIQALIAKENARVAEEGGTVVRIAFLGTFTFGDVSPMDPGRVRRALEGAYTAMMRANHSHDFGDPSPQIQLVLANTGAQQEHWETVVDDLVAMTSEPVPLVAVVGMGVSIESTRSAARRLAENEVPMVSSAVTADGLDHFEIPGLLRAAPSNSEYVRALRNYLDGLEEAPRATLVYDTTEPDLFVSTLRRAYEDQLGQYVTGQAQEFSGTTVGDAPRAGLFDTVTLNVCVAESDTVLFAGRTPDLDAFLESLAARSCDDTPIRVLFVVVGLSALADEDTMALLDEGDITLVHASGIDPRWATGGPDADVPPGYAAFRSAFAREVDDDPTALRNGYALVTHDAFAVAASAVRTTNAMELDGPPLPPDVLHQLMLLNSAHVVPAGAGVFSYGPERGGEAVGRYVPVVELPLEGDQPQERPYVIGR